MSRTYAAPCKRLQTKILTDARTDCTELHPLPAPAIVPKSSDNLAPAAKNADVQISKIDQVLVEAKLIAVLKEGTGTRSCFYQKIGASFALKSSELDRILIEMEKKQLIQSFREARDWHVERFKLCS